MAVYFQVAVSMSTLVVDNYIVLTVYEFSLLMLHPVEVHLLFSFAPSYIIGRGEIVGIVHTSHTTEQLKFMVSHINNYAMKSII